jgi:hypothetical protein
MSARYHEQAHVGEARTLIAQVLHTEDARLQPLACRIERPRKRTVVAYLAGPGEGGADAGDFSEVVR